ncbi:MAG: DUF5937 family protein [Actinomycetota bacterium]|nr:DUF5937 family protein [Actinomycetota bacterium]
MSVALDITGLAPEQFVFAPSPLAELGSTLHAITEPAHHRAQAGWIATIASSVEPGLMDQLIDADFLWRTSRADLLLPASPRPSLLEELDQWDTLDDEDWVRAALITSSCGALSPRSDLGSPLTDPLARELVRDRATARGLRQLDFVQAVLESPTTARNWIRGLLLQCAEQFFDDVWTKIIGHLRADARTKHDQLTTKGLAQALAAISPSLHLDKSGQRITVDKLQDSYTSAGQAGITFLPSVFGHPHLLVVHAAGWRPVLQYPIATAGVGAQHPASLDDIQQRLHALDHPLRIRLARSLIRGPHTTGELSDSWNLTAPEVSRNLALLRQAGLVTSHRDGRYVRYSLDLVNTARLGGDIIDALLR